MPEVLKELGQLPVGSHCVGFYVSHEEAADHAADFLAGAPEGQAASYWVGDASLEAYYKERLAERAPEQVGCVHVLDHEQVHEVDGKLRPVDEVLQFVGTHPDGVTAAGDTMSRFLTEENVHEHLEYEAWFEEQPRDASRFLCPYDLRKIPPGEAPRVLQALGAHHSHVVLSGSDEPAVRLLQLFVFGTPGQLPPELGESLRWAMQAGLVWTAGPSYEMSLTEAGDRIVREWSRSATLDW